MNAGWRWWRCHQDRIHGPLTLGAVSGLMEWGGVALDSSSSGGSGSGGAIYLKGSNVIINSGVTISASGGLLILNTLTIATSQVAILGRAMVEVLVLLPVVVVEFIWKQPVP